MKKFALLLCLILLISGCGVKQRTEVISAVIDDKVNIGWNEEAGMGTAFKTITARVKFDIYNCGEIKTAVGNDSVREWLTDYAVCYDGGEKLPLDSYITFESSKEKKHTFIVDYIVSLADEADTPDLSFSFILEGFETNYEGEFENINSEEEPA